MKHGPTELVELWVNLSIFSPFITPNFYPPYCNIVIQRQNFWDKEYKPYEEGLLGTFGENTVTCTCSHLSSQTTQEHPG